MVALAEGTRAPALSLSAADGKIFDLGATLQSQPLVVLAFFKVSCPVCQLAFPFLERIHQNYPEIPMWGISQDDAAATDAYAKMFGCTFPMLLDQTLSSTVDFGLTNVPTVFLVNAKQEIILSMVGFIKNDLEKLNADLAQAAGQSTKPLFTAADEVPALKPG